MPFSSATTILYSQDFSDEGANRDKWFARQGPNKLKISGDDEALLLENGGGYQEYAVLYFSESPLYIEENSTIQLSWTYSFAGINSEANSSDLWKRIGLFNSGTSDAYPNGTYRVGTDSWTTADNDAFKGYTGYRISQDNVSAGGSANIKKRNNDPSGSTTLVADGPYGSAHGAINPEDQMGYANAPSRYNAILNITNTGDSGMLIEYTVFDLGDNPAFITSWLDNERDAVNTFDTFLIGIAPGVGDFNIHQMEIVYIPEPSSSLPVMATLLFFGGVFSRRRRTT